MAFNAPFVHHTKTAEKLQKTASYATGVGVIVGVLAFFIALDDTGSAIAGLLISATVIVSAILAGGGSLRDICHYGNRCESGQ